MRSATRLAACAATAVLAAGTLAATPASAAGSVAPVVCPGVQNAVYTPGLTLEPRDVTVHIDANYLCGATSTSVSRNPNASCIGAALPYVREVLQWTDDRSNSTIEYDTAVSARVAEGVLVTLLGQVLSGEYQGSLAKKEVLAVTSQELEIECLTEEGLQSANSAVSLTLTNLL